CVCVPHPSAHVLASRCLPPSSTLFPYTTLFRSRPCACLRGSRRPPSGGSGLAGHVSKEGAHAVRQDHPRAHGLRRRLGGGARPRSEEHTSELQSRENLVCRLLLEKKKKSNHTTE